MPERKMVYGKKEPDHFAPIATYIAGKTFSTYSHIAPHIIGANLLGPTDDKPYQLLFKKVIIEMAGMIGYTVSFREMKK